jgi:uncharacterized DUF497 family protein
MSNMEIEFDKTKDVVNMAKHGLPLADAALLDWETLWAEEDTRSDYGEVRMLGHAMMDDRLFCVVYTDRIMVRRIISLRKANNREKRRYAKLYND